MVDVFVDSIRKRYVANRCSLAWWSCIVLTLVLWILPFFLGLWSYNFWKTHDTYDEVPHITFNNQLILMTEGVHSSDVLLWSTMRDVNDAIGYDNIRAASIYASHNDTNDDGRADFISIRVQLPLNNGEEVRRATVAMFMNVELNQRIKLKMKSMLFVQNSSPYGGSELHVNGDVLLRQVEPLNVRRSRSLYDTPLIPEAHVHSVKDTLFPHLLNRDFERNETLELRTHSTYWQTGAGSRTFTIFLKLRVPLQSIEYIPSAGEVLKFAWVQYIAIWVILYYVINRSMQFCYGQQVFSTRVVTDPVVKKEHEF